MKFSNSHGAFSVLALFAAASTMSVPARAATEIPIANATELREKISHKPTETDPTSYDGAKFILPAGNFNFEANATAVDEATLLTAIIRAQGTTLAGATTGGTIFNTIGSGDAFRLAATNFSVADMTIQSQSESAAAGALAPEDGRFIHLIFGDLNLRDVIFGARNFKPGEKHLFGAAGGAIFSSLNYDRISATAGTVEFSKITTFGNTFSSTDGAGNTVSTSFAAAGGAVFLAGTFEATGTLSVLKFSQNCAESANSGAFGGALYITNKGENVDGSAAGTYTATSILAGQYGFVARAGTITFEQNTASAIGSTTTAAATFGGAVSISGGAFWAISDAAGVVLQFSKNTANAAGGVSGGGALALSNGGLLSLDAASSFFAEENTVTTSADFMSASGGAFFIEDSTAKILSTNFSFSQNEATASGGGAIAQGGAIAISGGASVVNLTGTSGANWIFSENKVSATGVAAEETVTNGDTSQQVLRTPTAQGGALAIMGGKLDFATAGAVAFSLNSAESLEKGTRTRGGAIFVSGEETSAKFAGTFNFSQNNSNSQGGGENAGGAIFLDSGTLELASAGTSIFQHNYAQGAEVSGGAIAISGGALKISGTFSFSYNTATSIFGISKFAHGGAIFQAAGTLDATDAGTWEFAQNNAQAAADASQIEPAIAAGGAIYQAAGTQKYVGTTFNFTYNSAMVDSVKEGAQTSGGAIYTALSADFSIAGEATFSHNSALAERSGTGAGTSGLRTAAKGGAIFSAGTFAISGKSVFQGNFAEAQDDAGGYAQGGAIYLAGGSAQFGEVSFSNNRSDANNGFAHGGAIYQASGTFALGAANFDTNFARGAIAQGGAIYSSGEIKITLKDGEEAVFQDNSAIGSAPAGNVLGGAIFKSGGPLTVAGTGDLSLVGNSANASGSDAFAAGGAIAITSGTLNLIPAGTLEIRSNSAETTGIDAGSLSAGGAIYSVGASTHLAGTPAQNAIISGNIANSDAGKAFGGAIYLAGGTHRLENITLSQNAAEGEIAGAGGAIYIDASGTLATTLTLAGNTEISENSACVGMTSRANGIAIGNGISSADSNSNVALKIVPATGETVKLIDPLDATLTGTTATLAIEKSADGGDFEWSGENAVSVESKKFVFSLGKGTTTLKNGFRLTGTQISEATIATGALLKIEAGASLLVGAKNTLAGTLDVAGTLDFATSKMTVNASGALNFLNNATSTLSGSNEITGKLSAHGSVNFNANPTEVSAGTFETVGFKVSTLAILADAATGVPANVNFQMLSQTQGALNVSAKTIDFEDSGTITLGTNTKLFVEKINATNKNVPVDALIDGSGTLVFLDSTSADQTIVFNSYFSRDTAGNTTYVPSGFQLGENVKVESGVQINQGTTLSLKNSAQEYKRVVIVGGTLLAPSSSTANTLKLHTLLVQSSGAVLGEAGKNQAFEMISAGTDSSGNPLAVETVSLNGKFDITETTTFIGDIVLGSTFNANLTGAGTLVGNASGAGIISIAKIDGNLSAPAGKTLTLAGTTAVTGTVSVAENAGQKGVFAFAENAALSATHFTNAGTVRSGKNTAFTGEFENSGTLSVAGTFTLGAGSTFTQTAAGTLDISAAGTVDFSAAGAVVLAGKIVVNPASMKAGTLLNSLLGLSVGALDNVSVMTTASMNISDRIEWSNALGGYIFLGLNGTVLRTTLYGDLTRENIARTYDFMRAGLLHGVATSVHPSIFSKKTPSKYMRKYLENQQRFIEKPAENVPAESVPAKTFEKFVQNAWFQAQYTHSHAGRAGENLDYNLNGYGAHIGASLPLAGATSELGGAFGYNFDRMKHVGENAHKIDTDAYALMAFARRAGETFDFTLALSGIYTLNDSKRGESRADFDAWQAGALAEIGATFRPEIRCEIRPFFNAQSVYSRTESFGETGGNAPLSVDSDSSTAFRLASGLGVALLPWERVQLTFRATYSYDLGAAEYGSGAFDAATRTDYQLRSRAPSRSALELGAYLNFRLTDSLSLFGGYTGTLRSGMEEHRANLGAQLAF